MKPYGGGLSAWSLRHPVGVVMIALSVVVLGGFSLAKLNIDLLPRITYPDVRVRIIDPGVPTQIMEDQVTRQLEEQLAITENAIDIQSRTTEGRSAVDLSFAYGVDVDQALRDASSRLDRAKRFLPDGIDPPVIYKRDPSQLPVAELVVSSSQMDPVELRQWVDYDLSRWFLNLPGVAAAEVGGGLQREIQILPDQERLAALGLDILDLQDALSEGNVDSPGGRLTLSRQELTGRTRGRFESLEDIASLPIALPGSGSPTIELQEIAQVVDGHQEERLRVRLNDVPGIKVSVQKQPQANTISVADSIKERLNWLRDNTQLPSHISIALVGDQSTFVRLSLENAARAALSGGLLAMLVVWLFLGNLRRTLIIGSAIPIAIMVTFTLMALGGLTLNIMTLGGLALGIGMLVDNTIVMLENIVRHQRTGEHHSTLDSRELAAADQAAAEVHSAIIASTSTNLAAVLPFLFISGLVGLLFKDLIFTISAAIAASLLVALTIVPALAARVQEDRPSAFRRLVDGIMQTLQGVYGRLLAPMLRFNWLVLVVFLAAIAWAAPQFFSAKQTFLPSVDEGRVSVYITADSGINLNEMDAAVERIEQILREDEQVATWFSTVGGFIFGRSEYESANRSSIQVQLTADNDRADSAAWLKTFNRKVGKLKLAGIKVRARAQGVRGIRLSSGDDDISIRIQGNDQETLAQIADAMVEKLRSVDGLRNLQHSAEDSGQELSIRVDRERAIRAGLSVDDVGQALQLALDGITVTDYIEQDRSMDIRLQLPPADMSTPEDLNGLLLFPGDNQQAVRLGDIADISLQATPLSILRDKQRRIVEISASLAPNALLGEVRQSVQKALADQQLPAGYKRYDGGAFETLKEGKNTAAILLGLALFLVFVVMAVQYESLRNPLIILLSVPFASIGVVLGLQAWQLPLSMPVWLGMIMLAGIVVNNAIVLVETIEQHRQRGMDKTPAILQAARLRLRPILMTTLTTVVGMLPLALALGEGAEMLQPLAVTIVAGLGFSVLVSLVLVPCIYSLLGSAQNRANTQKPLATS